MTTDGISHKILSDLKYDVEELKKKLTQPDAKASELILEIESLKDSIHELSLIFQKTLEEMKGEDLSITIKEKMEAILGQNETIARGMVAISDKVDEFMKSSRGMPAMPSVGPSPMIKHSLGMPEMPERMAPRPTMETMQESNLPPPPPRMEKRRGLFH